MADAIIEIENLTRKFGDFTAVDNISLSVNRGEIFAFLGPNGAGKSTLLKIIAGVLPFDSGTRKLGHQVELGYFSQTRLDVLALRTRGVWRAVRRLALGLSRYRI
jgi:ATP-binding cassette subfamily F protein 3